MVRGVLAAAGVTIVTASTADQLSVPGVVYRPFVEPTPTLDVGLAWRADDSSPVLTALVQIADQLARTSPG
jgi:DNA-binding transcriptional LysR family regulator